MMYEYYPRNAANRVPAIAEEVALTIGLRNCRSPCYTTNFRPDFRLDPELVKRCDRERWEEAESRRTRRAAKKQRTKQ